MKLEYRQNGDYFLPEIALSEQTTKPLGKYGRLRLTHLQAQYLLDTMIPPMTKVAGATEQLKTTEQIRWVGLMDTVKAQVEEIIFAELIYN